MEFLPANSSLQIRERELRDEGEIHNYIENQSGISLGGVKVFIINSEQSTRTGVRADILGLAETGHPVILELKQADGGRKGSRTALIQALEYAADFRSESYRGLSEKYANYADSDTPLNVAHADYFSLDEPLAESAFTMATDPRIVLLAEHFEPSDIDAARYLRDANDVDITCVEVTPYDVAGDRVYGFECRLQSKTAPSRPLRSSDDEALPWLIERLEQSYYERFGDEFGIGSPIKATEREGFHKGTRFVSRPALSDDLRFSVKLSVYDEPPTFEFGVSPDGNERIEKVIDANTNAISESYKHRDRNWRRVRGEVNLASVLADAQLTTVSPEVGETIGRVLWDSDEFQRAWQDFLDMVKQWDGILHDELSS